MRRTLCLFAVAASLAGPSVAFAQQKPVSPQEHEQAVAAFQEGKRLRDDNKCEQAIPKLEESRSKEDSIGARYNLGYCYEKTGNKKLALANYKRAEQIAKEKNDDREREIGAQIRSFFNVTTHIRLALPQPLPPDLQVTIDGETLPNEEFEGLQIYFPPAKRQQYELRVTAAGYEEVKQPIDAPTVDKKLVVTVVLRKKGDGTIIQPPPRVVRTKWGPFQFLGLGIIALGAVGMTFAAVRHIAYASEEANLLEKFNAAQQKAEGCPAASGPETTCGKNIATREELRKVYNDNEEKGREERPLVLTFGIGGVAAVLGGIALIVFGPRTEVDSPPTDPGAEAKAKTPPRPTFRVLPTFDARQQGLSVVGTF